MEKYVADAIYACNPEETPWRLLGRLTPTTLYTHQTFFGQKPSKPKYFRIVISVEEVYEDVKIADEGHP